MPEVCPVRGELNQYGRPDNWADRTVDALLAAHAEGGNIAAQLRFNEIIQQDQPRQVDAIVASGRFRQIMEEARNEAA